MHADELERNRRLNSPRLPLRLLSAECGRHKFAVLPLRLLQRHRALPVLARRRDAKPEVGRPVCIRRAEPELHAVAVGNLLDRICVDDLRVANGNRDEEMRLRPSRRGELASEIRNIRLLHLELRNALPFRNGAVRTRLCKETHSDFRGRIGFRREGCGRGYSRTENRFRFHVSFHLSCLPLLCRNYSRVALFGSTQ